MLENDRKSIWQRLKNKITRKPPTGSDLRRKAFRQLREGKLKQSLLFLKKAIELEPSNIESRINMGVALYLLNRYDEALEHFQFVIALDPQNATALLNLAATYDMLGRLDEALPVLQKLSNLFPDMPDVHYNLAVVLAKKGNRNDAIFELNQELTLNPDHQQALKLLQQLTSE